MTKGLMARLAAGLGVALLVFLGLKLLDPFGRRTDTPAAIEAAGMRDPAVARYLTAFKETFPAEYARSLTDMAAMAKAGATSEQASATAFALTRGLITRHRDALIHAPDAALRVHAQAQNALLNGADTATCAAVFTGGFGPGDTIPEAVKTRVADMTAATLRATRAGLDAPAKRPDKPSAADIEALMAAAKARGMTEAQRAQFFGETAPGTPADTCAVGRQVTGAVADLPPAQGGRVWSFILASSVPG